MQSDVVVVPMINAIKLILNKLSQTDLIKFLIPIAHTHTHSYFSTFTFVQACIDVFSFLYAVWLKVCTWLLNLPTCDYRKSSISLPFLPLFSALPEENRQIKS